ncbi:MAG: winged helix DNA-binding domain-containing protein [Nocardioidaceae bacterium]
MTRGDVLSARALNRTLLQRQHLLERTSMGALEMTEHLMGLQAQEPLPPYLSLWSRIRDFDAEPLSQALEDRTAVRLLLMRGTIHLVTPADAVLLRGFVQPMLVKMTRTSQASRPAADVPRAELATAARAAFDSGPLPVRRLGELLAEQFPGVPSGALANTAREMLPLVQVPPRGRWRRSGGVVYELLDTWLGIEPMAPEPPEPPEPRDSADIVRRYLRAFGPATPADVTTWCGLSGMRPVFVAMKDELRSYRDAEGRELFDLDGLPIAGEDTEAPVRLLGRYDNVWLSHDRRDRVTPDPANRKRWMGVNGGVGCTVFVDGALQGLWRQAASGKVELELFRVLTRTEQTKLDEEVAALESFLSR